MSDEIIDVEAVEITYEDLFNRSKANNYAFESNKLVNWSDSSQEIQADYFLEGDREPSSVIKIFSKIANTLSTHAEHRLTHRDTAKSLSTALPVDLLYDRDLKVNPESIDNFIGRSALEMNVQDLLGNQGYMKYRKKLEEAQEGDPKALLNTFLTEESAQKVLADKYPGYAKYFEQYRKQVQANDFLPATNESEEVLTLLSKMIRYPGAISQAELDKHEKFVSEISKYFKRKRVPTSSASIERMTDEMYDILIKYLTDPPEDKDKDNSEGDGDGNEGDDKSPGNSALPNSHPFNSGDSDKDSEDDEGDERAFEVSKKSGFGDDSSNSENSYDLEENDPNAEYDVSDQLADSGVDVKRKNWEHQTKTHEEVLKDLKKKSEEIAKKSKLENLVQKYDDVNEAKDEIKTSFEELKKDREPKQTVEKDIEEYVHKNYASDEQVLRDAALSPRLINRFNDLRDYAPLHRANVLKNKLRVQIRDYDFSVKGVKSGRLDTNKIVEAAQSVENVYERLGHVETNKVSVGILIDESGSMSGPNMESAVKTAIMIEHALGKQKNINLFIYGHHSRGHSCIVTRYIEPGYGKPQNLGASVATGANYDGDAIALCAKRMRSLTKDPVLFFVISDGAPSAAGYGGHSGEKHVKKIVNFIEKKMDMTVVQIAIESHVPSDRMFNNFVKFTNLNTLPNDLSKYVSTHLKKKLKSKVIM